MCVEKVLHYAAIITFCGATRGNVFLLSIILGRSQAEVMKSFIEQNVKSGKLTDEVAIQMMKQLVLSSPPVKFLKNEKGQRKYPLFVTFVLLFLQNHYKIATNEWKSVS